MLMEGRKVGRERDPRHDLQVNVFLFEFFFFFFDVRLGTVCTSVETEITTNSRIRTRGVAIFRPIFFSTE